MNFKEWLELDESSYVTRTRDMTYPPPADGLAGRSSKSYKELEAYKGQLRAVKKLNRHLINIDPTTVYDIPYWSPDSVSKPGEGGWVHKPDDSSKPSIRVTVTKNPPKFGIESSTLPGDGFWQHKHDDNTRGAIRIVPHKD